MSSMVQQSADFILLVGTKAGAFLFLSNAGRTRWERRGPYLPDCDVNAVALALDQQTLFAATHRGVFRSRDFAAHWEPETPDCNSSAAGKSLLLRATLFM